MDTSIGKAAPASPPQRVLLAAVAVLIVAADLLLSWKGQYMTPYRLGFLIVALGAYGSLMRWDSASLGLTLRPVRGFWYWIKAAILIGVIMLALILVSLPVLRAFGTHLSLPGRAPSEALPWFYFACINAPILEEVIYRFILCVPLVAICGPWGTIALSTIAFAGLHFATGVASPDNVVAGVFLAWAFLKSGSLAVPMALHALGNACILVAEIAAWYWKGYEGMERSEILTWLQERNPDRLKELWALAENIRKENVGDAVHLRGLLEISNYCCRQCGYCGLRSENRGLERYRMTADEIMECVGLAVNYGYGTVVMQAGEDYGIETEWLAGIVRRIKTETPLAVTLSLGERPDEDLVAWREAGANRYLLRFETSDPELYRLIHPSHAGRLSDRIAMLRRLKELGYEAGSGVMAGIPSQTYESLAGDIEMFRALDLDMIGIGPYISHPATPLGSGDWTRPIPKEDQVPNTELMTYKAVALTRIVCPQANIPSTTALATINKAMGREYGLMRGANVVMPNLTPTKYRRLYEIYPAKACIDETSDECRVCLHARIKRIDRTVGAGPGGRRRSEDRFS